MQSKWQNHIEATGMCLEVTGCKIIVLSLWVFNKNLKSWRFCDRSDGDVRPGLSSLVSEYSKKLPESKYKNAMLLKPESKNMELLSSMNRSKKVLASLVIL